MAEQEKKSGGANGSPVVVVEQTAASKHMPPYRAQELQEEQTEVHAKRSKGPAVSSISLEKHVSKKVSSSTKRRAPSPDNIIKVSTVEVEPKKDTVPPQPIPAQLKLAEQVERKENKDDSIDDVTELRTAPTLSNDSEDEEEAGRLPRSESRASRVSRAMRQLLCCGVRIEPPTEQKESSRRFEAI